MFFAHIFIGASAATIGAVNKLTQLKPDASILIFTDQKEIPYNKCLLADYLAGTKEREDLHIFNNKSALVQILYNTAVTAIDRDNKTITTNRGALFSYASLFIGTGSSAFVPLIEGINSSGVFTFHTLADVNALLHEINERAIKSAIIVGAGLSGLECADALLKRGVSLTILERNDQVLMHLLSKKGANFLQERIKKEGINLKLSTGISHIISKDGHAIGISLANGSNIFADIIIIATGLKANTTLATSAGITVSTHGIKVNEFMQSSDPSIYAGGDVIEIFDEISATSMRGCLWPDAMLQGIIAAHAMVGLPKKYPGAAIITSSAFFGLKFARAGKLEHTLITHQTELLCHQFAVKEGILSGFEVLGTDHNLGQLRRTLLTKSVFKKEELF
jgi:ferredoxin-nitrate reductase